MHRIAPEGTFPSNFMACAGYNFGKELLPLNDDVSGLVHTRTADFIAHVRGAPIISGIHIMLAHVMHHTPFPPPSRHGTCSVPHKGNLPLEYMQTRVLCLPPPSTPSTPFPYRDSNLQILHVPSPPIPPYLLRAPLMSSLAHPSPFLAPIAAAATFLFLSLQVPYISFL